MMPSREMAEAFLEMTFFVTSEGAIPLRSRHGRTGDPEFDKFVDRTITARAPQALFRFTAVVSAEASPIPAQKWNWHSAGVVESTASVIVFDINHFKRINDVHGHAAHDRVLQALGDRLRELAAPSNLVARMSGEEFCIAMPGARREQASACAEAILAHCRNTTVRANLA